MAAGAFSVCDAFVAAREGGYQDSPADPGNYADGTLIGTNRGISAPVLATYLGRDPTVADMQGLTAAEAAAIRTTFYWSKINGDALPSGIDLMVYDDAVNRGVQAAATLLQANLGVGADGVIGPITIAAAGADPVRLAGSLGAAQISAYLFDRNFATFGLGWLRRMAERFSTAMGMIV